MIDREALLTDLKRLVVSLQDDLRTRATSADVPDVGRRLADEYARASAARRTAATFEAWREGEITQLAVAWVLSCVFARFLEDNGLVDAARIAGPAGERLEDARDARLAFIRRQPHDTDREYLLDLFDSLAALPGTADIFGAVNPIRWLPNWLSPEAATSLVTFFQTIDSTTGHLAHDFTDPAWDTRFLGDLYQDLSEAARKRFALLQTPDFVEKFLLDRTLEPALDEFQSEFKAGSFKMIDPACGSGHLVIGSFKRIFERLQRAEPAASRRELVIRSLACVHGVDVNPFAAAIARFRLLLAAMQAADIKRLADAPAFTLQIACGDSLLHASMIKDDPTRYTSLVMDGLDEATTPAKKGRGGKKAKPKAAAEDDACDHVYAAENLDVLRRLLTRGQYHAVVANPPYITPKDPILNERYRRRFGSCHMKYSLSVPFLEQIFLLAAPGGFTGQITANSFMKREFGKKLIEEFFPTVDLTHVIDTSGAYIPGHGTPTVILFGRRRPPVADTVRAVMGIRGEPSTPADPTQGLVWTSITTQIDEAGSQSEFVSVSDTPRTSFHSHPWSIGGGGAAELKEVLEATAEATLSDNAKTAIGVVTLEDDAFSSDRPAWLRHRVVGNSLVEFVEGDRVRDWSIDCSVSALFPYDRDTFKPFVSVAAKRRLWEFRTNLAKRYWFQKTQVERELTWWEYGMLAVNTARIPLSITFAEVATHNHFVLDRGGKVFKQTAPVIKLPAEATEDKHLALLGILNSSTVCFWMKQVCHQKQMMGGDGIRITDKSKVPYAFSGTALGKMPLPADWVSSSLRDELIECTRRTDALAAEYSSLSAETLLQTGSWAGNLRHEWVNREGRRQEIRSQQIFLQEHIDWLVYRMFGLTSDDALIGDCAQIHGLGLTPGDRPYCIASGTNSDGFDVPTSVPKHWPEVIQEVWRARIAALERIPSLRLIESAMYKRRWIGRQGLFNHARDSDDLATALRSWLLDRIESYFDFDGRMNDAGTPTARFPNAKEGEIVSVARIADEARRDPLFQEAGEVYRDDRAFDVLALVSELVASESVPALPVERYKPSGLLKRRQWERTWELQRAEDAIDARINLPDGDPNKLTADEAAREKQDTVGDIPVPPKYAQADFLPGPFWRLRGKLDVPKERFVSFPSVTTADGTALVAWAGSDHLQLARAVSGLFVDIRDRQGTHDDPRLVPLLAVLVDLLPWLRQYHGEIDPEFGVSPADSFATFVAEEARKLGKSTADLAAWAPPPKAKRAKKAPKKKPPVADDAPDDAPDDDLTDPPPGDDGI